MRTIGAIPVAFVRARGTVTNLASRPCDKPGNGEILVSARVHAAVEDLVDSERVADVTLEGFHKPITPHNVRGCGPLRRRPAAPTRS